MFDTGQMPASPVTAPLPVPGTQVTALEQRVRPGSTTAAERTLPVTGALTPLFPAGLPRGVTLAVTGNAARSFLFAIVAAATRSGSWLGILGMADPGWRAAAEAGVATDRIVVVDTRGSGGRDAECVAAALDGFDLVLMGSTLHPTSGTARRLAARARERGTVLLAEDGPLGKGADITVQARSDHWRGLGTGWGHLAGRRVSMHAEGRRVPGRRRRVRLWLPDADGGVASCAAAVAPTELPVGSRQQPA